MCYTHSILYLPIIAILGVIWLIAPAICWYISKENTIEIPLAKLNKDEKEYLKLKMYMLYMEVPKILLLLLENLLLTHLYFLKNFFAFLFLLV